MCQKIQIENSRSFNYFDSTIVTIWKVDLLSSYQDVTQDERAIQVHNRNVALAKRCY